MATEIWVNIGSGNGLLPDSTKPLPEPMLPCVMSSDIHLRLILQEIPQPSITKISSKIACQIFQSNLPGAKELNESQTSLAVDIQIIPLGVRLEEYQMYMLSILCAQLVFPG